MLTLISSYKKMFPMPLPHSLAILELVQAQGCPIVRLGRVHVAAGGNIIRNQFLTMAKCRGDGREPPQRVQRAVVAVLWC